MPKVFEIDGFRFFFFSNEGNPLEPCHIHVAKGDGYAKFWIEPEIRIAEADGFSLKELRFVEEQIVIRMQQIREAWNDYFN